MEQDRIPVASVSDIIKEKVSLRKLFEKLTD
jgi:hypothetical protein